MWSKYFSVLFVCVLQQCASEFNTNFYCADMNPQPHVNIEQLMGIWYGIEIISHKQNKEPGVEIFDSCPVIYISAEEVVTTESLLHKDYNYEYNYGEGYRSTMPTTGSTRGSHYRREPHDNPYHRGRYGSKNYARRYYEDIKKLKIMWDENGSFIEYIVRYNVSRAGFWISSGPYNGSALDPSLNQFAGTIQVLKAVDDHLVLVFCHQLPDRQLYTVLLSRLPRLSNQEIHGVHNLLNRRELSTANVRKVCRSRAHGLFGSSVTVILVPFVLLKLSFVTYVS